MITESARHYRNIGYWFATGYWFAQGRTKWTPDFSSDFGDHCAARRQLYMDGGCTSLPSIPDMWTEYLNDMEAMK